MQNLKKVLKLLKIAFLLILSSTLAGCGTTTSLDLGVEEEIEVPEVTIIQVPSSYSQAEGEAELGVQRVPQITSLAWGGGVTVLGDLTGAITYTQDGRTWRRVQVASGPIVSLTWGSGCFLALAGAEVWTASLGNLSSWTRVLLSPRNPLTTSTHGFGKFVVAGENGAVFVSRNSCPNSASSWSPASSGIHTTFRALAFNGNHFISGHFLWSGTILSRSMNGFSWSQIEVEGHGRRVVYSIAAQPGGRAVAVGSRGMILVSDSSLDRFRAVSSPTSNQLNSVAWGPRGFVAVGLSGTVLSSTDGINWVRFRIRELEGVDLNVVAWGGGVYLIGGAGRLAILR